MEVSIEERIVSTIDKIRPYIHRDGGDVIFRSYEDGIVYVEMLGACVDCGIQDTTLKDGIEAILLDEVPEIKEVRLHEDAISMFP